MAKESLEHELAAAVAHLKGLAQWQQETATDWDLIVPGEGTPMAASEAPRAQPPEPPATSSAEPHPPAARRQEGPAARDALQRLRAETVGDCQRCGLCADRQTIVFGVGDPNARLMFIGEGPGAEEDRRGEPFVGRAGQLLDRMIGAMGLRRDDVYIANIVKCRPPGNRDPQADEVAACEPFLKAQIRIVQPEVIVTLGRVAAQTLLRSTTSMGRPRNQWHSYEEIPLMATYHPAYLLRSPDMKRPAWADLQLVMERLNLERPPRQG